MPFLLDFFEMRNATSAAPSVDPLPLNCGGTSSVTHPGDSAARRKTIFDKIQAIAMCKPNVFSVVHVAGWNTSASNQTHVSFPTFARPANHHPHVRLLEACTPLGALSRHQYNLSTTKKIHQEAENPNNNQSVKTVRSLRDCSRNLFKQKERKKSRNRQKKRLHGVQC